MKPAPFEYSRPADIDEACALLAADDGARVIAAVSSEAKLAFAKKHGADDGVVYPPGPFDKAGARALADIDASVDAQGYAKHVKLNSQTQGGGNGGH